MKSKDLSKIVFSKYQHGDCSIKIFRNRKAGFSLKMVERRCKMTRTNSGFKRLKSLGPRRTVWTKENNQRIRNQMNPRKGCLFKDCSMNHVFPGQVSVWSLNMIFNGVCMGKSLNSNRLMLSSCEKRNSDRVQTNFQKEDTVRVLFSDENCPIRPFVMESNF